MLSIILISIGCVALLVAWWLYDIEYLILGLTTGAVAIAILVIGIIKLDWGSIGIWINENSAQIEYEKPQIKEKGRVWACRDKLFSLTNEKECKWEEEE